MRTRLIAWVVFSLFTGGFAHALDLKIGYVNAVRVMEEAPSGQAALERLKSEFGPRSKELATTQDKIKTLEQDLDKNAVVIKESERRNKERELMTLRREIKRATQEFREDYNVRRNEELAALQKVVHKAIVEIAKQEKYDLILHEGAIYAGEKIDITEQILKKLGKK